MKRTIAVLLLALVASVGAQDAGTDAAVDGQDAAANTLIDLINRIVDKRDGLRKSYEADANECKKVDDECVNTLNTVGRQDIVALAGTKKQETDTVDAEMANAATAKRDSAKQNRELNEKIDQCDKEKAEYEATIATAKKLADAIRRALKAMAFVQGGQVAQVSGIQELLYTADAMGLMDSTPSAFLQAAAGASRHDGTNAITQMLDELSNRAADHQKTKESEMLTADSACMSEQAAIRSAISSSEAAKDTALSTAEKALGKMAAAHDLLNADMDELTATYHKLRANTKRCRQLKMDMEHSERDARGELKAVCSALKSLGKKYPKCAEVSFLQVQEVSWDFPTRQEVVDFRPVFPKRDSALSLVQVRSQTAGPFKTIKNVIQKLIVRLEREAQKEGGQHGKCMTEMKSSRIDLNAAFEDSNELASDVLSLSSAIEAVKRKMISLVKELESTRDDYEDTRESVVNKAGNLTSWINQTSTIGKNLELAIQALNAYQAKSATGATGGQQTDAGFGAIVNMLKALMKDVTAQRDFMANEKSNMLEEHIVFTRETKADKTRMERGYEHAVTELARLRTSRDQATTQLVARITDLGEAAWSVVDITRRCPSVASLEGAEAIAALKKKAQDNVNSIEQQITELEAASNALGR